MTIDQILRTASIDRRDAELLLAYVLGTSRTTLFAHGHDELSQEHVTQFQVYAERRRNHEPVAYILGTKDFYGRSFSVRQPVLIPRPSTEALVDQALIALKSHQLTSCVQEADADIIIWSHRLREKTWSDVVDLGTGSGCIAVTLACEVPSCFIRAIDCDPRCITLAQENAQCYGVSDRLSLQCGDGIEALQNIRQPFLLVSNPPYIPSSVMLMPDVALYESPAALWSGEQGIDLLTSIVRACHEHSCCTGMILECRADQRALLDSMCYPVTR